MMQNKIYLLLVVFLLFVIQITSFDLFTGKGSSVSDRKSYTTDDGYYDSDTDKNKPARLNDDYSQTSTYRRNRYSPYGSSSNNYRSRSRLPSSYDEKFDSNDWSPYGNPLASFLGPLPPAAFDSGAYLGNGPSCYSLLDPQYPLFSDICGAIPQARYSLPNAFGHVERWQMAQILTSIAGQQTPTSANPVCTRSIRLLLCPLLFPPCPTRYEAPPVLPCQQFCRVVKNQCATPSLDLLPCDLLPPTSDLCPINPSPYSSLLSSFGQPLPLNGGLSPPGFPPGLSSILAQSALLSGLSPSDIPPSMFSSGMMPPGFPSPYPSDIPPSMFSSGMMPPGFQSPYPSDIPPSMFSSGMMPPGFSSPYPSDVGSPYSSGMMPPGFPSRYPSAGTPSNVPSSSLFSLLSSAGVSPSGFPSLFSSSGAPLSPLNPHFNTEPYMADNLTPILVDFPPLQYAQKYRPTSRFFPALRSATEKV